MSNHLALAAATRTLTQLLDAQLTRDFAGAHVLSGRPDAAANDDSDPEVRLFLYRVEPNASWRTAGLPARSSSGQVYERSQVGLTLHYLLTFVGNEASLEPQRMLGSVVRTLNARPLLTRPEIEHMVAAAAAENPAHPLALSDLAEQPETVRLSPLPLTLDELSSLWSSFFQSPYRLSVAYEACVVVLTADEQPTRALPVQKRALFSTTITRPSVSRVVAKDAPSGPIHPGTAVVVTGTQLQGDELTVVALGGVEVTPATTQVSGNRIEVDIPDDVRAGVNALRILHRRQMGEPPTLRLTAQSAISPVVIQPRLLAPAPTAHDVQVDADTGLRSGAITVHVEPSVGDRQQVTVLLNAAPGGSAGSFVFEDERRDTDGQPELTSDLHVPFAGVPAGTYLLRVAVDGAETPLITDTTSGSPTEGQYVGPTVVVP